MWNLMVDFYYNPDMNWNHNITYYSLENGEQSVNAFSLKKEEAKSKNHTWHMIDIDVEINGVLSRNKKQESADGS